MPVSASVFGSGFGAWASLDVAAKRQSAALKIAVNVDFMAASLAHQATPCAVFVLGNAHHLDAEDQRRIVRNRPAARAPVGERWRNDEPAPSADLHAGNPLVPAPDHLAGAERELKRGPADGRIEL